MNNIKCKDCAYFDEQFKYVNGKKVSLWYGLCGKKSVYPTKEQDGQEFPQDAIRAEQGALAKPVIVEKDSVKPECIDVLKK